MEYSEILEKAIEGIRKHVPEAGKVVAEAYKNGELQTVEENLYVIAELMDMIKRG